MAWSPILLSFNLCFLVFLLGNANASLRDPFSIISSNSSQSIIDWLVNKLNLDSDVYGETTTVTDKLVERRLHLSPRGSSGASYESSKIGHYAGYYKLDDTYDSRMFYLFFESRNNPSSDPVILWMTGGPGCSSELAVLYENGPFKINPDNSTLSWNPYGWDTLANVIFVDQPIGTGYSYSSDKRDIRHDEKGVSQDVYQFLQEFFSTHSKFVNNEFFVTGESYAGHYVPAVTSKVHNENKQGSGLKINLKGFAIGNGLTEPSIQYPSYADFALFNNLISKSQHAVFSSKYKACKLAIKACGSNGKLSCTAAYVLCNVWFESIFTACGDINMYDIRLPCTYSPLCYDFSPLEKYLGQDRVRNALGVEKKFEACSSDVYNAMISDFMRNLEPVIPSLLEDDVRLLVYAGNADFICNWLGNSRWVASMPWSGQNDYLNSAWLKFVVDGEVSGISSNYGPLSFLTIYGAGHMVPMDQPAASLEMIRRFIHSEPMGQVDDRVAEAPHPMAKSPSLL